MQDRIRGWGWWAVFLGVVLALGACGKRFEVVEIQMSQKTVAAGGGAQISVRVKHPPAGIMYRWRADRGRCEPQESPRLTTEYKAPLEPGAERVTLEVLSERGRILATKDITFKIIPPIIAQATSEVGPTPLPSVHGQVRITITQFPPYDPDGGPASRADIAGEVSGVDADKYRVVIYAYTDKWYVQPLVAAPFTDIHPDGTWETWTHTGTRYLVLVVPAGFQPRLTMTHPDESFDGVIGRKIVEGRR